jgi:hypothetical protein
MIKYNLTLKNDSSETIAGFDNLNIENLDKLINGTIDFIVCEILDKLNYNDRLKTINTIFKKLSFGGEVTFKFMNAYQLCKNIVKGDMTSKSLSETIQDLNSLFLESDTIDIMNQMENVKIIKVYNNNNYIIMNIKKTNE